MQSGDSGGEACILLMQWEPSPRDLKTSYFWQVPGKARGALWREVPLGEDGPALRLTLGDPGRISWSPSLGSLILGSSRPAPCPGLSPAARLRLEREQGAFTGRRLDRLAR